MIAWQLHGGGFTASHLFQGQLLRTLLPVFAEELEYMEFFLFFFPLPTSHRFPWVESGFPLDSQKNQAGGKKTEWDCTAGCTFGQLRGGHGRAE